MKLLPDTATQLCLPLAPRRSEPAIADAGDVVVVHQRRPDSRKLPAEFTDAELLTKVLGPSTALSCEWLTTTYDDLHTIAFLSHADLSEHGFTSGAIDKLSAVFEIAKRYGEREWKAGEPLRGSSDVYAHFREHLAAETCEDVLRRAARQQKSQAPRRHGEQGVPHRLHRPPA